MTEDFASTLRSNMSFGLAVLVTLVLIAGVIIATASWTEVFISLAVICLGYAVGACVGTAISPADDREQKRFASYGKAVVAFATGYVASKLDGVLAVLMASPSMAAASPTTLFRVLAFTVMALVVARTTFTCRSYDGPA